MLVVPRESAPAKRGDDYALADANVAARGSQTEPEYVTVVCPVCATRMYATEDRLGQTMNCPDCDSPVVIRRSEKVTDKESPRPAVTEEYALYQGEGQPPPSDHEVYQTYIPVVCPVCQTRMLATENEVGQELTCPDCDTRVRVPPLAVKEPVEQAPRSQEERLDAYDVAGGAPAAVSPDGAGGAPVRGEDTGKMPVPPDGPPGGTGLPPVQGKSTPGGTGVPPVQGKKPVPPAKQALILVVCSVCHTRLHATADEVGHEILCPDCYTPLIVPEAPAEKEVSKETIEEYQVGATAPDAPLPIYIPGFDPIVGEGPLRPKERPVREEPVRPAKRSLSPQRNRRGQAPSLASAFFSGVFNFPLYPDSWSHWVALSLWMLFVVALAREAVMIGTLTHPLTWFACAMMSAVAGLLLLTWLIRASGTLMDIVRDTANGADQVEPSDELWIDRLFEFLFPATAFGLAVLLGVGVDRLLTLVGLATLWAVPLVVFLLFPIVLLSMLEVGSPLGVVSLPVLSSLRAAWPAWLLFYVQTLLLFGAVSGAGWLASLAHFWLGAIVAIVAEVWMLMVYCRLLGRLAWYCGQEDH